MVVLIKHKIKDAEGKEQEVRKVNQEIINLSLNMETRVLELDVTEYDEQGMGSGIGKQTIENVVSVTVVPFDTQIDVMDM